jgi:xanthine dehydrogenase accessory factor
MHVVGDTRIAHALIELATGMGYEIGEGDETAVVVASHGRDEEDVLATALEAGVPYVGLVASRKRGKAVVESLEVSDDDRARVHTPAGLDIGARTPEEIALSILAEIVSTRRARTTPPPVEHHHEGHCCHE